MVELRAIAGGLSGVVARVCGMELFSRVAGNFIQSDEALFFCASHTDCDPAQKQSFFPGTNTVTCLSDFDLMLSSR